MSSSLFQKLEEENNRFVYLDVTEILLKILENVLRAPDNPKYRRLRLVNEVVSGTVLAAEGGMECLLYFGFQMTDDAFILPLSVPLSKLKTIRDELYESRKIYMSKIKTDLSISRSPTTRYVFFEEVKRYSKQVLLYENKELQANARSKIPLDELHKRLEKRKRDKLDDFDREFGLLFEMMMWFKKEFFQWMDNPVCKKCDSSSTFQGYSKNPKNFINTDRVEVYFCDKCDARLLFPRYNNPAALLKTRTGRCGEWANCFTLLCRSLGYEARFVVDRTDHVWTEVYSNSLKRWIHIDSCESTIDAPLMYEKGWDKRLTYVLAFSNEEAQDVTWRYTSQFAEVRERRKECSEMALLKLLFQLSEHLQASLPEERKKYLRERRVAECVEFLSPPHSDKQYGGRISGSLQWRLSRGECEFKANKCTWQPNPIEVERKRFRLRYSTATDQYHRVESDEFIKGWENGVYELESVFRKIEHDWRMCYLCRIEGQSNGSIKWKFCAEKLGVAIDKVVIRYQCATFHNGSVRLVLCNEDTCFALDSKKNLFETDAFHGSYDLLLTAVMNGGSSDESWQHAQLFRQSIDDDKYLFEIDVSFYEDVENKKQY